jgi:hypothetical protein
MRGAIAGAGQAHYSFQPLAPPVREREAYLKFLLQVFVRLIDWDAVEHHETLCILVPAEPLSEFSECSAEEALIEMLLAGVSVRRVENIPEAMWGT